MTTNANTTLATTAATQRPHYARMGLAARGISFLVSTVLSTVLLASVAIGMTSPAGYAAAAGEQA